MTIIDQIKALALEGYGAEDIEVLTKGKITRDEAWGVMLWHEANRCKQTKQSNVLFAGFLIRAEPDRDRMNGGGS